MSNVDKIQAAEAQVQQMQDALTSVQAGLARAEQVAVTADEVTRRGRQTLKALFALVGVTLLLLVLSRRRSRS